MQYDSFKAVTKPLEKILGFFIMTTDVKNSAPRKSWEGEEFYPWRKQKGKGELKF